MRPLTPPITIEELREAVSVVGRDLKNDTSVRHPIEFQLFLSDKGARLAELEQQLATGTFAFVSAPIVDVPKGSALLRPVHHLALNDQIVFAVIGRRILDATHEHIVTSESPDYSDVLVSKPGRGKWFESYFPTHTAFVDCCIAFADCVSHVVETDISGFYENIDSNVLRSELRVLGVPNDVIEMLSFGLRAWSNGLDRGIPQGFTASNLLAKLYMLGLDQFLRNSKIIFLRYKDDIRIFATSELEAKRDLMLLIQQLRFRTLSVQTAKTKIYSSMEAIEAFTGFMPQLTAIANEFSVESKRRSLLLANLFISYDYMSVREVFEAQRDSAILPVEVLKAAYAKFIFGKASFNKSLFRYLLNNLAKEKDDSAALDAVMRLREHPQETPSILSYCGKLASAHSAITEVERFLLSSDCIYDFQAYQILEAFYRFRWRNGEAAARLGRHFISNSYAPYVRSIARALLGANGNRADLDHLAQGYSAAQTDLEKAELVYSLERLEPSRRNAFFARIASDGALVRLAIAAIRERGKA